MKATGDDLVEGRARRSRTITTVVVMVALVAALPLAYARLSGGAASTSVAEPTPAGGVEDLGGGIPGSPDLHGRLVYATFDATGSGDRQQRLVILDLESGELVEGPPVPAVEELVAAGRSGEWIVLTADDRGAQGVAYLLRDPVGGEPVELARGDVLELSGDGASLLVGRTRSIDGSEAGCRAHAYTLHRVDIGTAGETLLARGRLACGNLVSGALLGEIPMISVVRRGQPDVRVLAPNPPLGRAEVLFRGLALVSVTGHGTFLFADAEDGVLRGLGVWPRSPTGPLLVWPGSGSPRPLLRGANLFGQRVVAWEPEGGRVVVNGIRRGVQGMWLVYVPAGTAEPLLRPLPLRSALSGAAFDDRGVVFAGRPGTIVAATDAGIFPVPLPPDAPSPAGPLAWLP